MEKAKVTRFTSYAGRTSFEFQTTAYTPECFGYVDANSTGDYDVTVMSPYKGSAKTYRGRTEAAALNIMARHLQREGYGMPELPEA